MIEITSSEMFQDAISSNELTVVTWYTTWCPDSHRIKPFMPEIEQAYAETFKFVNIDRDKFPDEASIYQVEGIPSFIVFRNGEQISRFVSRFGKSQEEIQKFLNEVPTSFM